MLSCENAASTAEWFELKAAEETENSWKVFIAVDVSWICTVDICCKQGNKQLKCVEDAEETRNEQSNLKYEEKRWTDYKKKS